jgi:hypothetical protein
MGTSGICKQIDDKNFRRITMALVSPGVEVTVIDESQYIPSAVNTVPYFVVATAQNKVSSDGVTVAAGTLAANANKTYLITSQRDLAATFGVPFFYNTTTGTPINGYELNEYGLLAAYSALGVTNRAYIQRADVDLTALTASLTRPTGDPANGTYWLDSGISTWGIFEWNQATATFTNQIPAVITDVTEVVGGNGTNPIADNTPVASYGSIGDYAVTAIGEYVYGYYKTYQNIWVQIGSNAWKTAWPTLVGSNAPTTLTQGTNMYINDNLVTVGATTTVAGFAAVINAAAITGVTARAVSNQLYLYADARAANDGSTLGTNGIITVDAGPNPGTPALLTTLGITSGQYAAPDYFPGYSYEQPRWRTTDTDGGRPTGSVWQNVSSANNGMNLSIKSYSTALAVFVSQNCPVYLNDPTAIYGLDPSGGGKNIPVGTTYAEYDSSYYLSDTANGNFGPTFSFSLFERYAVGALEVTGTTIPTGTAFIVGNSFTIQATEAGQSTTSPTVTVTIGGSGTVSDFIAAVSAASVPYVSASVNTAGNIVFTHSQGGTIITALGTGTPLATAGFSLATPKVRQNVNAIPTTGLILSNFVTAPLFTYTTSITAPDQDPTTGRLWYYSSVSDADILIQDNGIWQGYQNVTNDVRGYDLTLCNATGPIISASAPVTQTDTAESPLAYGDLWIDTSDLENYPKLYRWQAVSGTDQWVEVDTTDQVSQSGILFADARWAPNGTTDCVADPFPSIASLLTSNYLDVDAPDPALYPQGMLLFNTRRSGYNVKSFQNNYFNATSTAFAIDAYSATTVYVFNDFVNYNNAVYVRNSATVGYVAGTVPTNGTFWDLLNTNTWLTASGNKTNGSMWSGRLAQRQLIVEALKAGIDTSTAAREEQNQFNLIATPAYPELTPNMIALSNERNNTLFVVGDTPMRLGPDGNSLVAFATNNNGLGLVTEDGNAATSNYAGVFYPSCRTTDLGGNSVVQPPSHMMVRTILRSDAASYPWFAPAGTRRGVIDNASAIGYINAATGEFEQIGVSQSVRDILYERNINPITFIPGIGITNFGNKTSTVTTTALDRINVARLVAFLRGRLEEIGKLFLFEPNDQITRNEISNTCNSLMIDLVAKRAIYDYLVVCDGSNNTPARIDRNELWVDIAIEPVKAIEFIYIPLRIKNTGEIAGGSGG